MKTNRNDKRSEFYSDEDIKQQDKMNNYYKVIALFSELDESFSDIKYIPYDKTTIDILIKKMYSEREEKENERKEILKDPAFFEPTDKEEIERIKEKKADDKILFNAREKDLLSAKYPNSKEYYPVEVFFEKQCEKEKESDQTFDIKVFAECEKERIEGILKQVKQLSDKSFYSKEETFKQAIKYIDYLSRVINGQTVKGPETFKTCYTDPQLNTIRERLINAKIISTISESNFLYLFTGKPIIKKMEVLNWLQFPPLGHEFLKRVVYVGVNFNFNQVNECIKFPKGHKLDSNDKSTAQYKNNEILNPILGV